MKQNVTELKDIEIQVHQDGTTYTYTLKADDQKEDWHRYTIPFLLFDPSPVLANLPITWIQWKYADSPNDGEIYLTDIKFGSHKSYENLKENLLLCQFYTEQQGISEQAFYISNIYFDIEVENDYPYVPTFGCSEYDFGIGYWRGPALVHYTCPLAPYVCNDNEVLDTYNAKKIIGSVSSLLGLDSTRELMDKFLEKYSSIEPFLLNDYSHELEVLQSPQDRKVIVDSVKCILCASCHAACPLTAFDEDYLGPATLTAVHRFGLDSRNKDRIAKIKQVNNSDEREKRKKGLIPALCLPIQI